MSVWIKHMDIDLENSAAESENSEWLDWFLNRYYI